MIQQVVEEIKFEDVQLSRKLNQAARTGKLRHWLEYLSMLHDNQQFAKKDATIRQLHQQFVFNADFWLKEVGRKAEQSTLHEQDIEFMLLSLDDGHHPECLAALLARLSALTKDSQIRLNFVSAKLEMLLEHPVMHVFQLSCVYSVLLEIYVSQGKVSETRRTFQRSIKSGCSDFDFFYLQYKKWEEDVGKAQDQDFSRIFQVGKGAWETAQIVKEQKIDYFLERVHLGEALSQSEIWTALYYLQQENRAHLNSELYSGFLALLKSDQDRKWCLRRCALSQKHEMVGEYLEVLESACCEEEEVITGFQNACSWETEQSYKEQYLNYLVRRLSKHLTESQDEEYNNNWGQKVTFFREKVSSFIDQIAAEPHLAENSLRTIKRLFQLWIRVEAQIVKDREAVCAVHTSYTDWDQSPAAYVAFAERILSMGDVKKAKYIFKKTCEAQNYHPDTATKFIGMLKLYGTVREIRQVKQRMALEEKKRLESKSQLESNGSGASKAKGPGERPPQQIPTPNSAEHPDQSSASDSLPSKKGQNQPSQEKQSISEEYSSAVHENTREPEKNQSGQTSISGKVEICKRIRIPDELQNCEAETGRSPRKKVHTEDEPSMQEKYERTLFISNVPTQWSKEDLKQRLNLPESIVEIRVVNKNGKCFCYVDYQSREAAQQEIQRNSSELQIHFSRPPSEKATDSTIFLSGLPSDVTEAQILRIIPSEQKNQVTQVRVRGSSAKRIAYVDFASSQVKESLLKELIAKKVEISGRTVIVRDCIKPQKAPVENRDLARSVFVKNLAFKCDEKNLRQFFQSQGFSSVSSVTIPKNQEKRPRGFAYVSFESQEELEKALSMKKGSVLGRQFEILKSEKKVNKEGAKASPNNHQKGNEFFSKLF